MLVPLTMTFVMAAGGEACLLQGGQAGPWSIVVSGDAIPSEQYAAEEFQRLYAEASGEELPIMNEPPAERRLILIGPDVAPFAVDDLGEEGLRVRIEPDCIAIAGGRPRGTLYGVYEFMERQLGVRFLTADHTHVPPLEETAAIPCGEYSYVPSFAFRWSYYSANQAHPSFGARLRVNTVTDSEELGGRARQSLINHTFYRYVNVDKYGAEHPEYFALVDGERKLDMGGGGPEPCVTNPDVIDIMAEGVLADIRSNPNRRNISLSQNDNDAYCRCPRCSFIDAMEGSPMGSTLYLVNAVADRVAEEFPDVKVGTLSYWYTRKPPLHMKPRPNVQIQLCSIECCVTHPLSAPSVAKNQEFCSDIEKWSAMCDDIWIWHYNTNFASYDLPFSNLRTIGSNVRFFRDHNVKGVFMQANGNGKAGEMGELRNYVMARCLWDPALDDWALVEEFCRLHYGAAGETVIAYLAYMHDIAQNSGHEPGCFGTPEQFGLNAEVAAKAMAFFAQAMEQAESDEVRNRVEKASICAHRCLLECGSSYEYADGVARIVFPAEHVDAIERYIALCEKHNMNMAAERIPIAEYVTKARAWAAGAPAARVENDTWRLTYLTDGPGKLIEMKHKPTGRDLLATWSRGGLRECGGTFEQLGESGIDMSPGAFTPELDGSTLVLSKTLDDGTIIERRTSLTAESVRFESKIMNGSDKSATYQIKIRPEWDIATTSGDPADVSAYVKDKEERVPCIERYLDSPQRCDDFLRTVTGGAFAFFNHKDSFGVLQTYDPEQFERPRFWWNKGRHQVNLELFTRREEVQPGGVYEYAFECRFLDRHE
ncbi:MAG: DUF4838 domain-containing protein [bacterium]|nr:DUF4838 domain-containing protein [bacterium]